MTIGCNIWMICLKLNWFFYGLSCMLQFSQFVWTPCYSVWDVFNNFLLIDATDRSKISSDQKRFFIALSLYTLSFFANTPFNIFWLVPKITKNYLIWCGTPSISTEQIWGFPLFPISNINDNELFFRESNLCHKLKFSDP